MTKLAIIGLGYVGLSLAVEFGKKFKTIGFDINEQRIKELRKGMDRTLEVEKEDLKLASKLSYTSIQENIRDCNVYIVTVPTPIDEYKRPDLSPLKNASKTIGQLLNNGDLVIYESTVYPGATEEICAPILEQQSGLKFICSAGKSRKKYELRETKGFFIGYSPERINPGDKAHRLTNIKKITSGSTPEILEKVDNLYRSIIVAGTYKASSIKVAESAKVIENIQRDINIALVNELALIFNRLKIDTEEVLLAAGTKWNFLPFRPGLVGGHCIGVDPYYLTHKASELGYYPEVILAGRRLNDNMGNYVADQVAKLMSKKLINIVDSSVLIMGLAFKENCPDLRNTRIIDLVEHFKVFNCNVDVYDPIVDNQEAQKYGIKLTNELKLNYYDAVILTVAHSQFLKMSVEEIRSFCKEKYVIYDVKYILSASESDGRL